MNGEPKSLVMPPPPRIDEGGGPGPVHGGSSSFNRHRSPWRLLRLSKLETAESQYQRRPSPDVGPSRLFAAALDATGALPLHVARRAGTPADDENGAGERRVMRAGSQCSESHGVARCRSPSIGRVVSQFDMLSVLRFLARVNVFFPEPI